jgi:hypothetical protein
MILEKVSVIITTGLQSLVVINALVFTQFKIVFLSDVILSVSLLASVSTGVLNAAVQRRKRRQS